jgi:hypothetical protein
MRARKSQFAKGQSGNPGGRPRGITDRRTELRKLLEPHAGELVQKLVELAKAGDTTALRICIDRLISPLRASDVPVKVPGLEGSLTKQGKTVMSAIGSGKLAPDTGSALLQALGTLVRIVEADELEKRVKKLEDASAEQPSAAILERQ